MYVRKSVASAVGSKSGEDLSLKREASKRLCEEAGRGSRKEKPRPPIQRFSHKSIRGQICSTSQQQWILLPSLLSSRP